MPLFPQPISQESQDFNSTSSQQSFTRTATCRRPSSSVSLVYSNLSQDTPRNWPSFPFTPLSVPGATYIPQQQYQFVLQEPYRQQAQSLVDQLSQLPVAMPSIELSNSEYVTDVLELKKPAKSNADSGTYTCTYHGCTLQFKTPTKLQKHKRRSHRQLVSPINGVTSSARHASSNGGSGITTSVALHRNLEAGPHKCEGINPSTSKPCNAIFSRPYDLTRHKDTIHNARKKVHCQFCTEEKTFSRNDALKRHMRVVHQEISFPRKNRRHV